MFQITQNMMVSQGFELELSMFRGTTVSGQHPLFRHGSKICRRIDHDNEVNGTCGQDGHSI